MFWVYFGVYTIVLLIIWAFFIVAKLHAYKFKNFSHNIEKVTIFLFIVLTILSVSGYIVIFFGVSNSSTTTVNVTKNSGYAEIDY